MRKRKKKTGPVLPPEEPKLSGPELARALHKDPATIRRWKDEGCPHEELTHGTVLYQLSKVLAWHQTHYKSKKAQQEAAKQKRAETYAEAAEVPA
jgi:hypothetical protein